MIRGFKTLVRRESGAQRPYRSPFKPVEAMALDRGLREGTLSSRHVPDWRFTAPYRRAKLAGLTGFK
jgi:hypothetical protein